jgi:hypothetical protein
MGEGATASVVMGDIAGRSWVAASATPVITPNDISIDRFRRYPNFSLTLENYAGCPAPTDGPWTQGKLDPASISTTLAIVGDFTIDWADGDTAVAHQLNLFRVSVP